MELTPGQQRLVFVVVVLALAGLGIYLLGNRGSGGTPAAASSAAASGPATGSAPSTSGAATSGAPPSTVPAPTPASTAGGAEIYQWLPFSAADLAAAAKTTLSFAAAYATWSYTDSPAAYAARLAGLATAPEVATLKYDYGTAGVAGPRIADKQVSAGRGTIDSIRSFGAGSITFVVAITQQVASTKPTKTVTGRYTVTTVSAGGSWQVNDIELAGLGNR